MKSARSGNRSGSFSVLPAAIDSAAQGDFAGLVGLNATFFSRKSTKLATGMHLSVVCAEDVPRLGQTGDEGFVPWLLHAGVRARMRSVDGMVLARVATPAGPTARVR